MKTNRILIVDDDLKVRKTLSDILSIKGYEPVTAATGVEATACVKESTPAFVVVLIDLKLDDMSGLEVMKEIKKHSPDTECIVLTGYASQETAIEAVNIGAYGYVQKPYDVDQLLLTIRRASEKRDAGLALRESEEKYRSLTETAADAIFTLDTEGKFTYLNPEFESVTGYAVEDFIGRSFIDILVPEYIESTVERFKRGLSGKTTDFYEVEVKHKDGGKIPLELNVTTLLDYEGASKGRIGIARDITERKQAETEKKKLEFQLQQARKMEALGTLAGGVAHDLNNVLGGIVSYPELLLMQLPKDSPLRKPISTIQKSGEKAAAIVQDMLTLARRGVTTREVVNLNDIISEQLETPAYEKLKFFHPDVRIVTKLEENLLNIMGSPVHLSTTVMNLISNAAEAMPDGGTIVVSTQNRYIDKPVKGYDDISEGDYVITISR